MSRSSLAQAIYETALSCGFDNCGIIPISALDGYKQRLQEREEAVPQSRPFYQNIEHLAAVRELYPWAKSVVVCITWLGAYRYPLSLQGLYGKAFLLSPNTVPDCEAHRQKQRFEAWLAEQGLRFEGGETNAPARIIPLRYAAVAAGLGIFRKNNFFYGEKGSYYELEGYLIDQPCEYTHECRLRPCADSCTLCQKACRTKALSAPYTMNPLSCTSFWTTFEQGAVPPHLTADQFTTWLCGCDACQDVCPYNRHDWSQGKDFPGLQELEPLLQPETIVAASDAELCDKVIPKTDLHISPDQVQTLRTSASRVVACTRLFKERSNAAMNILVLNGSPKAHSTTLDMTQAFLSGLCQTEPGHIQYISSYDKHVKYCQGDLSCWFRQDSRCIIQDDDMNDILAAMKESDVIVWSFPLHCHGLPASLKAIWDRTIAFLKINMTQGKTYVEHERTFDLTAKKHVVIVGGGYPYYPDNFAAVKTLMQIYLKHPAMACICETALLDASAPEIEPLKEALFARLHEAGIEYGKTGQLSAETVRQLESPLVPNETYIAMINSLAPETKAQ